MIIELHMLQNLAPSLPNRDDTGMPKDAMLGGVKRGRVSSQSWKRAARMYAKTHGLLTYEDTAVRTRELAGRNGIAGRLIAAGRDTDEACAVAVRALHDMGLETKNGEFKELVLVANRTVDAMADVCKLHWDGLLDAAMRDHDADQMDAAKAAGKGKRDKTKTNDKRVPTLNTVKNGMREAMRKYPSAEGAAFGRPVMAITDGSLDIDGAVQVAQAISTHKLDNEFDYFTAVDDLTTAHSGAGHLNTTAFFSATLYRYVAIDVPELHKNLGNDRAMTERVLRALIQGLGRAIPGGKQNSFAAHNPPSLVLTRLQKWSKTSLANAFLTPVRADHQGDLMANSIAALDDFLRRIDVMWGTAGLVRRIAVVDGAYRDRLAYINGEMVESFDELVEETIRSAMPITAEA